MHIAHSSQILNYQNIPVPVICPSSNYPCASTAMIHLNLDLGMAVSIDKPESKSESIVQVPNQKSLFQKGKEEFRLN